MFVSAYYITLNICQAFFHHRDKKFDKSGGQIYVI